MEHVIRANIIVYKADHTKLFLRKSFIGGRATMLAQVKKDFNAYSIVCWVSEDKRTADFDLMVFSSSK